MSIQKLAGLPKLSQKAAGFKRHDMNICFCRFLYVVGIQSIRIIKRLRRRASRFLRPLFNACRHLYDLSVGRRLLGLREEFRSIRSGFLIAGHRIRKASREGVFATVEECFQVTGISFRIHRGFTLSVFRIAVPVVSVFLLFCTVQYWNHLNFGLILVNNGEQIAVIQNESTYEKATELVNQRMIHDTVSGESQMKFKPSFQLAAGNKAFANTSDVCNKLIEQSNGIIEEASGLYVNGELMGVVKSGADLRYLIQEMLSKACGSDPKTTAQFLQNVEIENGLYPTTSILSTDDMSQLMTSTVKTGATYRVQDGDTVTSIARANHMKVSKLNQLNGNQLGDSIHPGSLINIEVAEPRLKIELIQTQTRQVPIPFKTIPRNDDSQYTDYTKVLTQGVDGVQECVDKVYTVDGTETKMETVSEKILSQPVDKVVLTGTKKRPKTESGISSGSLMWPVPSLHTITTYFTWRWGEFHYGIDISGTNAYGKTIVAADGGTVTDAGWDGGYGYRVVICHTGTLTTLYGHCSQLLVSAGQKVSKGQAIAKIGSTGNSTGPHCHFEVREGGTKVNPLNYVHN